MANIEELPPQETSVAFLCDGQVLRWCLPNRLYTGSADLMGKGQSAISNTIRTLRFHVGEVT